MAASAPPPFRPDQPIVKAEPAAAPPPIPGKDLAESGQLMPAPLRDEFDRVEEWANANRRDARHDGLQFWSLKMPAILASATTGVLTHYTSAGTLVAGAVASFCVLMDGLNPRGNLRNVHLRAFNELRILQNNMKSQWDIGTLRGEKSNVLAATIIEVAAKEKQRISNYVTSAEASLGTSRSSQTKNKSR